MTQRSKDEDNGRIGRRQTQAYGADLIDGQVEQAQRAEGGRLTVLLAAEHPVGVR